MSPAPRALADAYNIEDLRLKSRHRLPRGIFEYVDRGTEDDIAVRNNREAFERIKLVPRVLNDVSAVDTGATLFDRPLPMPLLIGATGGAALVWHDGDVALAKAAAAANIPFTISSASTIPIETIAAAGGRQWFQLYPWENRPLTYALVQKAYDLGCEALVVTVDTATTPNREYNFRNGFGVPLALGRRNTFDVVSHPRWMFAVLLRYFFTTGVPRQANLPEELRSKITSTPQVAAGFRCDTLCWEELRLLRRQWRGRLIIKGIVSPKDALQAVREGVDAIIVSNHGGRNLDSVIATIDALPNVLDAAGDKVPVMVDSGIRRGSDIVKALALGAKAVLVGRAPLYGLAVAGQTGVQHSIALLRQELVRVMAFCGCRNLDEITGELIHRARN